MLCKYNINEYVIFRYTYKLIVKVVNQTKNILSNLVRFLLNFEF